MKAPFFSSILITLEASERRCLLLLALDLVCSLYLMTFRTVPLLTLAILAILLMDLMGLTLILFLMAFTKATSSMTLGNHSQSFS